MQFRTLILGRADPAGRTVPVTVSTEEPVDRGDYVEILDHSQGGVDLSRSPLPLIESHDNSRLNIGVIENLRLSDGTLKGTARFGTSQRAEEVFQDVINRVVRSVSVGYMLTNEGTPVGDGRSLRFSWMPYEVSCVACPADTNAGFFRNYQDNTQMENAELSTQQTMTRSQRIAERNSDKIDRASEITAMARMFQEVEGARDMADNAIMSGEPLEGFRVRFMEYVSKMKSSTWTPKIGMSRPELRAYSVTRALRCMLPGPEGQRAMREAGLEMEASRAMATQMGREPQGMFIPPEALVRRDLVMGTPSAGGNLVQSTVMGNEFIDILRNKTIVMELGARVLTGVQGNIVLPRKTASATVAWVAEGAAPSEGAITFDQVTLSPKTVVGYVDYTKQLLATSSLAVDQLVTDDLLSGIAVALDAAALNGTGTANQPRGILSTSGIGSVVGGTNGATINWGHLVDLEAAVANANSEPNALAGYAINSKTRAWAKKTQRGTNLPFIWNDEAAAKPLNGYRTGVANSMPSNGTKGTASGACSSLIFSSNWADLLIALWGGLDVVVDPYTQATTTTVRVTVSQLADVGVRLPASFAAFTDALTA